jgi:tetratricopeptide (TPR) repeat protein
MKTPGVEAIRRDAFVLVLESYQRWAREHPDDETVQMESARSIFRVSQAGREGGDYELAVRLGRMAVTHFEQFVRDRPNATEPLRMLAWVYSDVGIALGKLGRFDEQWQAYQQAYALRQRILEIDPNYPRGARYLAWSLVNLGESLWHRDKSDEALDYFRRACAYWAEAYRQDPGNTWVPTQWAMTCQHMGDLELPRRPAEALRHYQDSRDRFAAVAQQAPRDPLSTQLLAESYVRLGRGHAASAENESAGRAYAQAVEMQEQMLRAYPAARTRYAAILSQTLSEVAKWQRALGQAAAAAETALKRRALWPDNGTELYDAACELALCVPVIGRGKPEGSSTLDAERRRYADLALETLRAAVGHGFQDWNHMAKDPDLDPLRTRAEFREILESRRPGQR